MLRDATFPPSDFQPISGMAEVKWDKIPAGENVTHAMVVMPMRPGYFNFTSADVTYKTSENAQESQVCSYDTHRNVMSEVLDFYKATEWNSAK